MSRMAEESDAVGKRGDVLDAEADTTYILYPIECWQGVAGVVTNDSVAEEVPVALVYNGISHVVMLASSADLEDFAVGFSLSEGVVRHLREILDIEIVSVAAGIEIHVTIVAECSHRLKELRRSLAGRTGCGLCGTEALEQMAARPVTQVPRRLVLAGGALARASQEISVAQPIFARTGAVHAAAWCSPSGEVRLVREDVGRHNALDKLIGALAAERSDFSDGFVLMTSRASYEIVQKAAVVGIELVAALSAPTAMAVRIAETSGITLAGFVRGDRYNLYAHPERFRQVHA